MIIVIGLYALFATYYILSKYLLEFAPPLFICALCSLLTGLVFLGIYIKQPKKSFILNKPITIALAQNAFFATFFVWFSMQYSLVYVSATKVLFYYAFTPFITIFVERLLLGSPIKARMLIGSLIAFFSLLPLIFADAQVIHAYQHCPVPLPLIDILLIAGVVAYAYGMVIKKELISTFNLQPAFINTTGMISSGILFLLLSHLFESSYTIHHAPIFYCWISIFVLAHTAAHTLYLKSLKYYSASLVALASCLEPLFGVTYDYFIFNHPITWHPLVALIGITIGLFLSQYKREKS